MSVLHARNRLVNFRLSEKEFERMKTASETCSARSVSDFARGAVLGAIERAEQGLDPLAEAKSEDVVKLQERVERLVEILERRNPEESYSGDESNRSLIG